MKKKSQLKAKCPYCGKLIISRTLHKHVSSKHMAAMQNKLDKKQENNNQRESKNVILKELISTQSKSEKPSIKINKLPIKGKEDYAFLDNYLKKLESKPLGRIPKISSKKEIPANPFIKRIVDKLAPVTIQNLSKKIQVDPGDIIKAIYKKSNLLLLENVVIKKEIIITASHEINWLSENKRIFKQKRSNKILNETEKEKKSKKKKKSHSIRAILIGHPYY